MSKGFFWATAISASVSVLFLVCQLFYRNFGDWKEATAFLEYAKQKLITLSYHKTRARNMNHASSY